MTLHGAGSVTRALRRSLLAGLTLLWLAGVIGSGFVLERLIDKMSDDEMQESATILMSLMSVRGDSLAAAAVLDQTRMHAVTAKTDERFVYQIRDPSGRVLLQSANAPLAHIDVPLREGFGNVGEWRVLTMFDKGNQLFVQFADPLVERREALVTALAWLTLPLAALLAFAAYIVFRASRSLVQQVERTARAVSRQDPQALSLLPLDGVVTEMRPAVMATNDLMSRLAAALEAERSFTYNSAHELRTPIAAALAQAQLLAANSRDTPLRHQADAVVAALGRLARLAERLLALARAEGAQPLSDEWVSLPRVVELTVREFESDPRLRGRRIVGETSPVRVRADLDAVGLALRNLVENALIHGSAGTAVRVVCERSPSGATLAVIDDGAGVPGHDVRPLAKRFARGAGAEGGGAGLGLSIVETLARRMGARLVLASPPTGQRTGFEARIVWEDGAG